MIIVSKGRAFRRMTAAILLLVGAGVPDFRFLRRRRLVQRADDAES